MEILRSKIAGLAADLDRLDATIERLTRDRQRAVTRTALEVLRRAGKPMGLRALTLAVMEAKGKDIADSALVNREMEKLRVSVTRQWQHGVLTREKGPGLTVAWGIAR